MQEVHTSSSLKNIRVTDFIYDGDATDVDMVMNLAKDVAYDGSTVDYTGIDSEGAPQQGLAPIIEGTLNVAGSVYADSAEFVREQYPNLVLNVAGGYYIRFADKAVQDICVANWGDGIGITEAQAAAVTSLSTKFTSNTEITSFDELKKFTGLTTISSRAFYGATNLQSIDLTNITTLTNGANFKNATSLNIVLNMPNYVGIIPYGAFENTAISGIENLGSATIIQGSPNVNAGGWDNHAAFRKCTNLKYANLPITLTTIQYAAFAGCTQLTEVNFADKSSITEIGVGAFCDVPIEFDIDFPNLTGTLGYAAFQNTKIRRVLNLGSISIIDGTGDGRGPYGSYGGWGAFKNCTELTDITLPTSLTTIGTQAFYGCTSLEIADLSLPNLTSLGQNAFYGVNIRKISNLGKITSLPNANSNTQNFGKKDILEEIVLPETLTYIPEYSFLGYSNLKKINTENIEKIGGYVFVNALNGVELRMSKLSTIEGNQLFYNSGVTILDFRGSTFTDTKDSFAQGATNLHTVYLPDTLKRIGYSAFDGCASLEIADLSLPNLELLESRAFIGVKITKISNLGKITAINPNHQDNANLGDKSVLKEVTLPNTIKTIGNYTFKDYTALETITIERGASGISVGAYAFEDLPSSINFNVDLGAFVSLGYGAFQGISI